MSVEENKAIVRRYIEEFWNKGDLEVADELVAPELHEAHPEHSGPEGEKRLRASFHTTFPGLNFEIKDMIAEGDRVVVDCTISGKHEGEWEGVAPTSKPFAVKGINIYQVSEGKIVGRHTTWDKLRLLKQISAFP